MRDLTEMSMYMSMCIVCTYYVQLYILIMYIIIIMCTYYVHTHYYSAMCIQYSVYYYSSVFYMQF